MLAITPLLALTVLLPTDTAVVDVSTALQMAEETSLVLEASRHRLEQASYRVGEARAWNAPQLEAVVENVGAIDPLLGTGMRAAEGQLLMSTRIRVGGARGAAIEQARAQQEAFAAEGELVRIGVRAAVLEAIAQAERDRTLWRQATEERLALEAFAEALQVGAELGRFPAGEAARAQSALVVAITDEARRLAAVARSDAHLAHLLGLGADGAVRVQTTDRCLAAEGAPETHTLPRMSLADAQLREADAALSLSRAQRIPDLEPQVGIRRSGGIDGLYLGLAFDLPLFGGTVQRSAAARAERAAVAAERTQVERLLNAEREAAARSLAALQSAGAFFAEGWDSALDLSVSAALANYELGEGTLGDLLQARQARAAALRDHAEWVAEVRTARIEAARLGHLPLDERALCTGTANIDR